jgi:ectoine hydroxylase-related dioxygenase (phytanoyl-CoA dioxygenase family)
MNMLAPHSGAFALPGWADRLREDGYCVIPGLLPGAQMAALDEELQPRFEATPFCEGYFNGYRTKRFHGLLKRSRGAAALVLNPTILEIVEALLLPYCEKVQLNLTQAVEIHPGELSQIPHRDQGMWPAKDRSTEYLINIMWPLSDYTPANGSTRLWKGSHKQPDLTSPAPREAVAAYMKPGDALVFLGSTLHGAGANDTDTIRRGILISYCLGWLKPYENMWLTYPPEIARTFPKPLQELVGYVQHKPNLGNYDGQCPSVLLGAQVPDVLATADAVLPAHEAALRAYAERERSEQGKA